MQQKNSSPQNHLQAENESAISALKCLNTKFINSLNRPSITNLHRPKPRISLQSLKNQGTINSKENLSTMSLLDGADLLFLEQFEKEDDKSASFTLTANIRHIDYTDSVVINNENTSSINDESLLDVSFPCISPQPIRNFNKNPVQPLKKESEIKFGNGGIFKGEVKDGKMINGTFVLDSMFTYQGGLLNDKFHGVGTLSFQNGQVISCIWSQGKPSGHVNIIYPRGQRYEGELADFKKHGIGCLYFNDGSRYVGEFHKGEITGQGCYYSNSKQEKRGQWINGEFQGQIETNLNFGPASKSSKSRRSLDLPQGQRQRFRIK